MKINLKRFLFIQLFLISLFRFTGPAFGTEELMDTTPTMAGMHSLNANLRDVLVPYFTPQAAGRMTQMNRFWKKGVTDARLPADETESVRVIKAELDRVLAPVTDPVQKPVLSFDFTEGFLAKVNRSPGGWEKFTHMLFRDKAKLERLTELNFQHFWSFMGRIKGIDVQTRNAAYKLAVNRSFPIRFMPFLCEVPCKEPAPHELQLAHSHESAVHQIFRRKGTGPFPALNQQQLNHVLWTSCTGELREVWKYIQMQAFNPIKSDIRVSPILGGFPFQEFVELVFLRTQDPEILRQATFTISDSDPELARVWYKKVSLITLTRSDLYSWYSTAKKLGLEDEADNVSIWMADLCDNEDTQCSTRRFLAHDYSKNGKAVEADRLYSSLYRQTGNLEYLVLIYKAYKNANPEIYNNKAIEWWQKLKSMPQYRELAGHGYFTIGQIDGRWWSEPLE